MKRKQTLQIRLLFELQKNTFTNPKIELRFCAAVITWEVKSVRLINTQHIISTLHPPSLCLETAFSDKAPPVKFCRLLPLLVRPAGCTSSYVAHFPEIRSSCANDLLMRARPRGITYHTYQLLRISF